MKTKVDLGKCSKVNSRVEQGTHFLHISILLFNVLNFTGIAVVFKRIQEGSKVTTSVVKCPRNFCFRCLFIENAFGYFNQT